jgi:hypothetical protein
LFPLSPFLIFMVILLAVALHTIRPSPLTSLRVFSASFLYSSLFTFVSLSQSVAARSMYSRATESCPTGRRTLDGAVRLVRVPCRSPRTAPLVPRVQTPYRPVNYLYEKGSSGIKKGWRS